MRTDLIGRELQVGDYVACTLKDYRQMRVAKVTKVTPKMVRVVYHAPWRSGRFCHEHYIVQDCVLLDPETVPDDLKLLAEQAYMSLRLQETEEKLRG